MEQVQNNSTENHCSVERREAVEQRAQRLLDQELKTLGWTRGDLRACPKGHPEKVRIARPLRQQTTISLKWIAERLEMGTWTHAANRIYEQTKTNFGK